jgi:hypothetical protein
MTSESIVQNAKSILGVDISPVSIELYNKRAGLLGHPADKMQGIAHELKGAPGELGGLKFDIVVVCIIFSF